MVSKCAPTTRTLSTSGYYLCFPPDSKSQLIGVPRHGKDVVDGLNVTDKQFLWG
jgi:hypothetical protein